MKKIVALLIVFLGLSFNVSVFADTEYNIKQAELIERYITKYKKEVTTLRNKYKLYNSEVIKNNFSEIEWLLFWLKIIKEWKTWNTPPEEVLKKVLTKFKTINSELKIYLEKEKRLSEKKSYYVNIWGKIKDKVYKLSSKMNTVLKKNKNLTEKEKKILEHLNKLEEIVKSIDYMERGNFESSEEMRNYLIKVVINMKGEIILLKKSLKW